MGQTKSTDHVEHFTGPVRGVDTKTLSSKLPAGAFLMLRNLDFNGDVQGYTVGKGSHAVNATSVGTGRILGLKRWYRGAQGTTPETVFAHGTGYYKLSALGVASSIGTGFTAGAEWFFEAYNPGAASTKYLYSVNGVDAPRRWDGTTLRTMGFPPRLAGIGGMSAAPGAAGVLTGTYQWAVTFVFDSNALHESSRLLGPTTTPTADSVDLASIPLGETGTTARNLYRTKAGGSQFFFLATISDNTTTTYNDNIADENLGIAQAPTDNGVPPSDLKFLMIRRDRAYGIRTSFPNRLYMSAVVSTERSLTGGATTHGQGVEIWPASHYIEVGDDGAPIVTLEWLRGHPIVFMRNRIFVHNGAALPTEMRLEDTGDVKGCCAARSVKNMGVREGIFFLGDSEGSPMVYRFNGVSAERIGDLIEPTLEEKCVGIGPSATVPPCAGRKQGRYILSYATNLGCTEFETAEFDTKNKRWEFWDNKEPAVFAECEGPDDTGQLLFGHARHGHIVEWGVGRGDFNADDPANPMTVWAKVTTGWLSMEAPNSVKQMKYIDLVGEGQEDAEIEITRSMNFDLGLAAVTSQDGGASVEGSPLTMEARMGAAFHKRVTCGYGERAIPDRGLVIQLDIEFGVEAHSEGDEYRRATLHDMLIYYSEAPPVSHEKERDDDKILEEIE